MPRALGDEILPWWRQRPGSRRDLDPVEGRGWDPVEAVVGGGLVDAGGRSGKLTSARGACRVL